MKTEEITALGVSPEAAEKIVQMNAAELAAETEKSTAAGKELETAKASLKDMTAKLKAYDGVDIDALKKSAAEWEKKYNDDMAALRFDHALDGALNAAKAKNLKAVKGLLDVSKLQLTDSGNIDGLASQLEAIKKSDGYMFESEEDNSPRIASTTKGPVSADTDSALRAAFGLSTKIN